MRKVESRQQGPPAKRRNCMDEVLATHCRADLVTECMKRNGHFPGEPGLAGVYWSKGWWRWWWQLDYWRYKSRKAPVKSSPPTNQHPVLYRLDALPVAHQQCQSTEGKISHSMVLLTPSSFGGLPTLSLTTNSSWLPWGRVAMPLISLLMPVPPDINRQVLLIHEQSTVRSKISRRRKNTLKNAWVNSVSSSFWRFLGFNLYRKNHGSLVTRKPLNSV